jgi:hypothetical protein
VTACAATLILSAFAAPGGAAPSSGSTVLGAPSDVPESVFSVRGVGSPGTPTRYDHVRVRRFGDPSARKVLVLVPGTQAGAADFDIVGPYLVRHVPDLQVWAEMRREAALQDDSVIQSALHGHTTLQEALDYYVGWIGDSAITNHYRPLLPASYGFVDQWGLAVAMGDLHRVILDARDHGRRTVILGGHSLGGIDAAIYSAWDFGGHAGYLDISGIVCIDGCAGPNTGHGSFSPTGAVMARLSLAELTAKGPWLDLLGVGLPWITGAFAELGAMAAIAAPNAPSLSQSLAILPSEFKPPVPATNEAQLGYAFDQKTSPPALALIHVRSGHLAASGTPRAWVNDGPTPVQNVADVFAQSPLGGIEWYFPERLNIDSEAGSDLQETPAATALGLHLTHLRQVDVPLYAFETSLGGAHNQVADGAMAFKKASRIPSVTIVNRSSTYSHLDPLLASPSQNAFLRTVVPWLKKIR